MCHKCENCESIHDGLYGSGRFCSSKCARSFSTKGKRKEINKKVSKCLKGRFRKGRFRKDRFCKYCNVKLVGYGLRVKVCSKCSPWNQNILLFKKLNVYEEGKSLEIISNKALDLLSDEYFNNKLSTIDLLKKYNIRESTTFFFFKKHGVNLRSSSESNTLSIELGKIDMPDNSNFAYSKCGWHTTWDGKKVYLRSSYELEYAQQLDEREVPYEVEFDRIRYYDTQKKKERVAIPDFFLLEENKIVEIKSSYTLDEQNMRDRFKAYKDLGYGVELIVDKKKCNIPE